MAELIACEPDKNKHVIPRPVVGAAECLCGTLRFMPCGDGHVRCEIAKPWTQSAQTRQRGS